MGRRKLPTLPTHQQHQQPLLSNAYSDEQLYRDRGVDLRLRVAGVPSPLVGGRVTYGDVPVVPGATFWLPLEVREEIES